MRRTITQRELRNDSGEILREVQAGRTMTVTRNGVPVAELSPVRRHIFASRSAIVEAAARAPRIDAAQFRADIDATIEGAIDG